MTRRSLLKNSFLLLGLPSIIHRSNFLNIDSNTINWDKIREYFPITSWEKLHLNSGSAGVMPNPVLDYTIEAIRYMNSKAPYEVWGEWQAIKKSNINRIQRMIGAPEQSVEIVRNTTEALNMIISGLQMKENGEVIISNNAYPFAVNAWENKATKEGIQIKKISYQLPDTDDAILNQYEEVISPETQVIHITHMTHREGHIQPIDRIIEMAHKRNIQVVVDGAHCIGQIPLNLKDSDIDFYASSLHKWLNAPHGTGLLYVKPELVPSLHNHPSSYPGASDKIAKFEHIGTRAFHQEIGIHAALDFHDQIGLIPKMNRLQSLKEYWVEQLKEEPKVNMHTNIDPKYSGAVSTLSVEGFSGGQLVKILDRDYDIHIKSVGGLWGSGVRMSVNIFHDYSDLDKFVYAIKEIAA